MPIGVLMPVGKDSDKSRAAKVSTVYKCIIAYNTVDHYVPLCKGFKNKSKNIYIAKYTPIPHQVF